MFVEKRVSSNKIFYERKNRALEQEQPNGPRLVLPEGAVGVPGASHLYMRNFIFYSGGLAEAHAGVLKRIIVKCNVRTCH